MVRMGRPCASRIRIAAPSTRYRSPAAGVSAGAASSTDGWVNPISRAVLLSVGSMMVRGAIAGAGDVDGARGGGARWRDGHRDRIHRGGDLLWLAGGWDDRDRTSLELSVALAQHVGGAGAGVPAGAMMTCAGLDPTLTTDCTAPVGSRMTADPLAASSQMVWPSRAVPSPAAPPRIGLPPIVDRAVVPTVEVAVLTCPVVWSASWMLPGWGVPAAGTSTVIGSVPWMSCRAAPVGSSTVTPSPLDPVITTLPAGQHGHAPDVAARAAVTGWRWPGCCSGRRRRCPRP